MRKIHKLVPAVVLAVASAEASAQMVYEPFDYGGSPVPANTALGGQTNPMTGAKWALGGAGADLTIADGSLTPPTGLSQPTAGNMVQWNNTNNARVERMPTGTVQSGDLYYSMNLKVTDITNLGGGAFMAGFNTDGGGSASVTFAGARLQFRKGATLGTWNIGIRQDVNNNIPGSGSTIAWDATDRAPGDQIFLVGRYHFANTSLIDDTSSLWILGNGGNITASDLGSAAAPATSLNSTGCDLIASGQTSLTGPLINSFFLRENSIGPATILADDIRVDTTWAAVTAPVGVTYSGASGGTWGTGGNWTGGTAPDAANTFANLTGAAAATVTVDGTRTVGTLNLNGAGGFTVNKTDGTGTLTFDGGAGNRAAVNVYAGNHTISTPVTLASDTETSVGSGSTLTVSGAVGGAGTLMKYGGGTLVLSGTNTHAGGTTVGYGTLAFTADGNLGPGPLVLTGGTGTLRTDAAVSAPSRNITLATTGGAVDTNGFDSALGTVEGPTGTFTKNGNGTLTVTHVRAGGIFQAQVTPSGSTPVTAAVGGLSVQGGTLKIAPDSTANGVSRVGTVAIGAGAKLDLTNNKLIVQGGATGTWNGTAYTGVTGLVATARNGGTWDGTTGITTSSASGKLTTLAVASAADIKNLTGTATDTWAGQTVSATDTLVMFTYGGDANMDGKINIDDYGRIDGHVGQNGSVFGWFNGDFNYDGAINIDDYGIIDGNIGNQGAPFPTAGGTISGVSAVPEPASFALFAAAACGMFIRRRRTR